MHIIKDFLPEHKDLVFRNEDQLMKSMKKRVTKYTKEPFEEVRIIKDFLPKPKYLVIREVSNANDTLSLKK